MAKHDGGATCSDSMYEYDVFLSFRGGTRHSFTDHLYDALRRNGIHTFRDDDKLKTGDVLGPSLLDAIEKSRMSIVVLCENYASSTWCLHELVKIMECSDNGKKRKVLPIFYKVEPSDIRKQKNRYGRAMIELERRFGKDSKKVKAWRSALFQVCNLKGEHCRNNMYEVELIRKIVHDSSAMLPPMPLQIKRSVGFGSRFEEVISLLEIESNNSVRMLGIYGAGGIGKTTFVTDLYNRIRHHFEAASFLANVREKSNKSINGLEDLQKTLLSEMGEETETMMMGSTVKGGSEIKRRVGHKRVLLVLDDVDNIQQLESLAGGTDWFGPHSRIVITTRDMDVLDRHHIEIKKYKMKSLSQRDSRELFCWHAFNMSRPKKNFVDVTKRAVKYAKGIPLALRVIGSNLKGRSVEEWEIELNKYKNVPDAKIQGVLEVSYNSLSELEQKIFLDIACFFKGEKWEYIKRILEACDFYPVIGVFVNKCLITIDENGCLEMQDLIQDMGKEIIRKQSPSNPSDRSRLWSYKEILKVLKENTGSSKIECIMLHPPEEVVVEHWDDTAFKKMKNLRILIVRNTRISVGPTYLPNQLRLLDWDGYPSETFPQDFCPDRIVDFNIHSTCLLVEKPFQEFKDLTFINLSYCQSITQFPDVSGAKKLRVLQLDRCRKLVRINKSVGFLPNLVYLSVSECPALESFVPKMHLPSLEMLSLNFCSRLECFPDVEQKMDKPLKIHMMGTAIKGLPDSIANLMGLEYMDMSFCRGLKDLPTSFLLLPKLVTLKIERCSQVRESFRRFKDGHSMANGCPNLKTLHFKEANLLDEDLPVIVEIFPKLEDLNVSYNLFVSLPERIKRSSCLKSLDVSHCSHLQKIPELPLSVRKVNANHCRSLTSEASSKLWTQVCKEIERIDVTMPKSSIPEWFDYVCEEDIPLFWSRRRFPVVALAFVFGGLNEIGRSEVIQGIMALDYQPVVLHLFVNGKEICRKDYRYLRVGEDNVLVCDLRVLFDDEEWRGLDASLGDDWKAVQVLCRPELELSQWGVYVYRQETNMEDIKFMLPNPNSSKANKSSLLIPIRTVPRETDVMFLLEAMARMNWSDESGFGRNHAACLMNTQFKMQCKASDYGASLINHEIDLLRDGHYDVPEHLVKLASSPEGQQTMELLEGKEATDKLKAYYMFDINLPIILEECHLESPSHHLVGYLEVKYSAPTWKAVKRRMYRLIIGSLNKGLTLAMTDLIVLLKCHCLSCSRESMEEEHQDPLLLETMRQLERLALETTSLNQAHMKLKASIVIPEHYHFPFDPFYQALFVIRNGNVGPYMQKPHCYRKLRKEHGEMRERYQVVEEHNTSNFPSRKCQPADELISMKNPCSMDEGSSLTNLKLEELVAVWTERDEELLKLHDVGIEDYKNSRDFEDLMCVVYLDGLSDGLIDAQLILMVLWYPSLCSVSWKVEEHASTSGYGRTLEVEYDDQLLQALLMMRQGYLGSGVGVADGPCSYGRWKVEHDSMRKKLKELCMQNRRPANVHCSARKYDELLAKFYTMSAELMSHQRNGIDRELEDTHGNDDDTVSGKESAIRRTVVPIKGRGKRDKEVDTKCEWLSGKLKHRGEELQQAFFFRVECLRNSQECFEDLMNAIYFEGLHDGFLEAQVSFIAFEPARRVQQGEPSEICG